MTLSIFALLCSHHHHLHNVFFIPNSKSASIKQTLPPFFPPDSGNYNSTSLTLTETSHNICTLDLAFFHFYKSILKGQHWVHWLRYHWRHRLPILECQGSSPGSTTNSSFLLRCPWETAGDGSRHLSSCCRLGDPDWVPHSRLQPGWAICGAAQQVEDLSLSAFQ